MVKSTSTKSRDESIRHPLVLIAQHDLDDPKLILLISDTFQSIIL